MSKFQVTYTLGHRQESGYGSFVSDSTMNNKTIVIEAHSSTDAERIVTALFGGRERVHINSAWRISG